MKCINCYSDIKYNVNKCPHCGTFQTEVEKVIDIDKKVVRNGVLLVTLTLILSFLGFIHFSISFFGLILSVYSFSYLFKKNNQDLKNNKIYYLITCVFVLVVSSIFFIGSIDELLVRKSMSSKIASDLKITLINEKPTQSNFYYNPENDRVIGTYYYELSEANISKMNNSVIMDSWKFGKLTDDEIKFLNKFIDINQSVLNSNDGYYLLFNRKINKFSVPSNTLKYDFVFLYYNPNKVDNYNLYIYDIKND